MAKFKRRFRCDKSIEKGIIWLNKNGFYTTGCCSGLKSEHDNERDRLYVEFEKLTHVKKYQIIIVARQTGLRVLSKNMLRIETEKESKIDLFEMFINALKHDIGNFTARTMGLSNWCRDVETNKLYSIQFYDYDLNGSAEIPSIDLERILDIFPLDCILYRTKHGFHFISFALRMGLRYTKSRAVETSKDLGKQDYWTEAKDLTLRVSAKWGLKRISTNRQIISKKPKFLALIKSPDKNIVSQKHLEFYFRFMNLPEEIFNLYQDCDLRDYKIKLYHYKTRD